MKTPKHKIDYCKSVLQEIRSDIKSKVLKKKLPDITYQLVRLDKPNHQDIKIYFDGLKLTWKESCELTQKLNSYYKQYQTSHGSSVGMIGINSYNHLKGKSMETMDHHDKCPTFPRYS